LERIGVDLEIGSIYPPLTSLRHEHISRLRAPVHYDAAPRKFLRNLGRKCENDWEHGQLSLLISTSKNTAGT
jgi:hypothetical protein